MEAFHDYAYYYNMFYKDKDYAKEAQIVCDLIKRYTEPNHERKILNIGCGTGRHDREFKHLKYNVHGIDLSDQMINIAVGMAEGIDGLTYEKQDARAFKTQSQYDIAVSLFHVMSYQNTNSDLQSVFSCVNQSLSDRGIFIFDAWYGPGVLNDKPTVRVKRVEDDKNYFVRVAEPVMYPNDNLVDVRYNVNVVDKSTGIARSINEVHKMRYFFKPEIEEFLSRNGMRLIECVDCETLKEPDFNSWTVYFCARKEKG